MFGRRGFSCAPAGAFTTVRPNPQLALWATGARCSAAWDGNYKPWRLGDLFGKRKTSLTWPAGLRKTKSLLAAAATEWRLDSSPRCNRGFYRATEPAPDGAEEMFGRRGFSCAPAGAFTTVRPNPQLALWATGARCSAAWAADLAAWATRAAWRLVGEKKKTR